MTIDTVAIAGTFSEEELEFSSSAEIQPLYKKANHHKCGVVDIDTNLDESFTTLKPNEFWPNAKISWHFFSIGDEYKKYSASVDANIGLSKADVDTVKAAMKQIEDKTCFKFELTKNPTKGQPWLLIQRIARHRDLSCQLSYVQKSLVIRFPDTWLDYPWKQFKKEDVCFSGAFAFYGSASPQFLVISKTKLDSTDQADVGLIVHELLHNLGLGHTQKRQDAKDHIVINWKNIDEISHRQYKTCTKQDDPACKYYNTYGTPYDCKSIMNYGDMTFITDEAKNQGLKTMVAKDPSTCELSSYGYSQLSETDVDLIKKMYCK